MPDPDRPFGDEEALLAAARGGDAAALGELMGRFRLYLLRVAGDDLDARVRPKVMPSDVVQDALLEAYRLFDRFDGAGADAFRHWLRGILHNKAREAAARYLGTAMRDAGREVGLADAATAAAPGPSPSTDACRQDEAARLRAAVDRLPPTPSRVLRWRSWDGLSFAEIGARLGRSEVAARMLFARALKRLEEELADGRDTDPG